MEDLLAHMPTLLDGPYRLKWKRHMGGMFDIFAEVSEAMSEVCRVV